MKDCIEINDPEFKELMDEYFVLDREYAAVKSEADELHKILRSFYESN